MISFHLIISHHAPDLTANRTSLGYSLQVGGDAVRKCNLANKVKNDPLDPILSLILHPPQSPYNLFRLPRQPDRARHFDILRIPIPLAPQLLMYRARAIDR
jgi:hypothetical protein